MSKKRNKRSVQVKSNGKQFNKFYWWLGIIFLILVVLVALPQSRSFLEDCWYGTQKLDTMLITLPNREQLKVEVARTATEQEIGLMFREKLAPNRGMIFVYDEEGIHIFWMKNTFIDLDMVFIGADKRVLSIAANVPRTTSDTPDFQIPRRSGYGKYVLEIPAGRAKELGIEIGTQFLFPL